MGTPPAAHEIATMASAAADITPADLVKLMREFNRQSRREDAGLVASIHRLLGADRPVLEVCLDGRRLISVYGDGQVLVIDRDHFLRPETRNTQPGA